jgi:GNAT superfamily N-acetyltransferase
MVTIRPSVRADIDPVLRLWARFGSAVATLEDTPADVERLRQHDPGALLVADRSGRVVGALIAGFDGWRGVMHRLVVEPDLRREGIATQLVAAGEGRLRRLGAQRVTALVGAAERPAQRLWLAAGYSHDPTMSRFVKNL